MPGSTSSEEQCEEHLHFKLVLLGDKAVGKTAIARRLARSVFDPSCHTPTVGAEFYKAELSLSDGVHATLQVWDIGSNVSSLSMAANYLHGCDAVLAVHDITRAETFTQACQWLDLLQQMFQQTALPYVAVIANKADTADLAAAAARLHASTASTAHMYRYYVSAKIGTNIKSTFLNIAGDLAGIPLTQKQLDAAHAVTLPEQQTTAQQQPQCQIDMPGSSVQAKPVTGSGMHSRRPCGSVKPAACSSPQQQTMNSSNSERQPGELDSLTGLQTCRCCFNCRQM